MTIPEQNDEPSSNENSKTDLSQGRGGHPASQQEGTDGGIVGEAKEGQQASSKKDGPKRSPQSLSSFEQLIEYAYKQKGRKLSLASKHEKTIAQSLRLSDDALLRLSGLAEADVSFAVPVQLLLLARKAPRVHAAIRAFVQKLLLAHPALQDPELQAAIQNLESGLDPKDALAKIVEVDLTDAKKTASKKQKKGQLLRLKSNLIGCLAVWIADTNGLSVATMTDLLYTSCWSARSGHIADETAQFRALIGVNDMEGISVACQVFRSVAEECREGSRSSMLEAGALRSRLGNAETEIGLLRHELEVAKAQCDSQVKQMERQLAETKEAARNEATHLRDDHEVLRTRVLRALKSDLSLLEGGLEALRRPVPKVAVMEDAAERVTDSMRKGIREVQGDR